MKKNILGILFFTLIFCFFSSFLFSQICFYPYKNYSAGANTNTKAIASGDFNNDGKQDLAVAVVTPSMVSILLGDGTGKFSLAGSYTITNTQPYAIACIDFNNDGKMDVAVANNGSALQGVTILLGNGAGGFTTANSYTTTGTNPAGVAVGYFNNDGNADVAITNYNSSPGTVSVYMGNGNGTLGAATTYTVGTNPGGIIAVDVNKDNRPDLITANSGSNNVTVLLNNAVGGFYLAGSFTVGSGTLSPKELIAGDFNSDGNIDLVTCNNSTSNVSLLTGNGNGQFNGPNQFVAGNGPLGITVHDFDGDGYADVAVANSSGNNVSLLRGNGAGSFYTAINFTTGLTPVKLTTADFNGDGKFDLATADESAASDSASVLLNSLPGPITVSGPLTTVCSGTSQTLTANGYNIGSYNWSTSGTTSTITVTPTTTSTYSVTGTNSTCTVVATGTFTVNTFSLPIVSANTAPSATVCAGTTITLSGSGAVSYIWSGGVTDEIGFIPTGTSSYTVTGTDANSCSNTAVKNITVNSLPIVSVNASPSATVCAGTTVTLSGSGATSYIWSGGITDGIGFIPTGTSTYTVTGTDANSCSNTATKNIIVNLLPTISVIASSSNICLGTSVTLSGSGAVNYVWSGGITDGIGFVPTSTATYTVTGTDANSCSNTATSTVTVATPPVPSICLVTVDSISQNNIIVWDKTPFLNVVDTFFIYRDTANNTYGLIGKIPYDSLSMFTDTVRHLFAANGNPNVSTWRYKIAAKDTCGNISAFSPYHQSLFIQNNSGNFSWNDYKIEGQPVPVPALSNYIFQRDDSSNGNWATIQTLSASSLAYTDPQYSAYQNTATWRVITAWSILCTPTIINPKNPNELATNFNLSRSNSYRANNASVHENSFENSIIIYPNPSSGEFNVQSTYFRIDSAEVYNLLGEKIYSKTLNSKFGTLNLNEASGIYFIRLKTVNGVVIKKIVME